MKQKEEEERLKEMEFEEIKKQTVFKAQPIRKYKVVEGRVNEKELTIPVSPNLKTSGRAQLRDKEGMEE